MKVGDLISSRGRLNYSGVMVYETKNMVYLDGERGVKMIPKANHDFMVNGRMISGTTLLKRPWERLL
ncbi:MAG: ribonuclease P protein subunit [Nitrososphaerota archaeon]|nr:ribonuclease P protein subunit [Nitrososphaerota archaeon]MDG7048596.1 ribonuclease P protein subunit [Nitrososphaerota archaeon]MDG7051429.1 ribonuclease P protein subunit [Nitrososphaerota archaeon]